MTKDLAEALEYMGLLDAYGYRVFFEVELSRDLGKRVVACHEDPDRPRVIGGGPTMAKAVEAILLKVTS